MKSITITSPNPAVIARLQEELPKLLASLERVTADKHIKRGYALTTISNEPVATDADQLYKTTLQEIAAMHIWGDHIADEGLRAEVTEIGEYDENGYCPSADTESTILREAVESARLALGLPTEIEAPIAA